MRIQERVSSVVWLGINLFFSFSPAFALDGAAEPRGLPTNYFYVCQTLPNSGPIYLWHHARLAKDPVTLKLIVHWDRHVEFSRELEGLTEIASAKAESLGGDFNLDIDLSEYVRISTIDRRSQNYDRLEIRSLLPNQIRPAQDKYPPKSLSKAGKSQFYLFAWQGENLKWFRSLTGCTKNSISRPLDRFNEM